MSLKSSLAEKFHFEGKLSKNKKSLSYNIIVAPKDIVEAVEAFDNDRRIIVEIPKVDPFPAALMKAGGVHYIMLNKQIIKKAGLTPDLSFPVSIWKDESKYGMPMAEEFEEMLRQDPEGLAFFDQCSPGKQRALIHIVNKLKSSKKRIEKSYIILEHLKYRQGHLDFKILNQEFKKGI